LKSIIDHHIEVLRPEFKEVKDGVVKKKLGRHLRKLLKIKGNVDKVKVNDDKDGTQILTYVNNVTVKIYMFETLK